VHLPAMDAIQFLILDRHIIERDSNPRILLASNHTSRHNFISWIAQKPIIARKIGVLAGGLGVKQIRHIIAFLITHITTPRRDSHPLISIHRFGLFTGSITIRQTLQSPRRRIAKITSRKFAYEVHCRYHNRNPLTSKESKFTLQTRNAWIPSERGCSFNWNALRHLTTLQTGYRTNIPPPRREHCTHKKHHKNYRICSILHSASKIRPFTICYSGPLIS